MLNRDKDSGTFVSLISREQEWLNLRGVHSRVTTAHSYFQNSFNVFLTIPSTNAGLISALRKIYKIRYIFYTI